MNEFVQIDIDEYRRLIELNESRRNQIDGLSVALAKSQSKGERLLKKYITVFGFEHLAKEGVPTEELVDLNNGKCFLSAYEVMKLMVIGFTPCEIETAIRLVVEDIKRGTEQ